MEKILLSEKFLVTGTVSDISFLKPKLIENHCLTNFSLENKHTDDQFWHLDVSTLFWDPCPDPIKQ